MHEFRHAVVDQSDGTRVARLTVVGQVRERHPLHRFQARINGELQLRPDTRFLESQDTDVEGGTAGAEVDEAAPVSGLSQLPHPVRDLIQELPPSLASCPDQSLPQSPDALLALVHGGS